jgi:hypothetical protein
MKRRDFLKWMAATGGVFVGGVAYGKQSDFNMFSFFFLTNS